MNTNNKFRASPMKWIILTALAIASIGCTDNQRAKTFGGSANHKLEANRKLVNVTWKQDSLWILTRPMRADDAVESYDFHEKSNFGLLEGSYTIQESRE